MTEPTNHPENHESWPSFSEHLDRALDLPAGERTAWLADVERRNPAMARRLRALFEHAEDGEFAAFLSASIPIPPVPGGQAMIGRRVGAYIIETEIGQGGMGSVWRATRADGRFTGYAAVKFVHASWLGRLGEQRFRREGKLLGRLNHPHIARLMDAGVLEDGQPYLVLEYVAGVPIDQYCESRNLDPQSRIRLFLGVLAAVAHAHSHLIVHRDLKPSNVLVSDDGNAKLLDFGIAKPLRSDAEVGELTRAGVAAMTPDYAAPEQLAGGTVTTAADVHALGLLLHRLLAGALPTRRDARAGGELTLASHTTTVPAQQRILAGDLDNILAKATRHRPEERYATVSAFADDLKRYLEDEPVQARPDTVGYRVGKFVRRHRGGVLTSVLMALALVVAIVVTTTQMIEARAQRDRAQAQLKRAEAFNDLVSLLLSETAPDQALTPRQLVDRGLQLVRSEFTSDPVVRSELLFTLATIFLQAGETDKERQLEKEARDLAAGAGDLLMTTLAGCSLARADAMAGQIVAAGQTIDRYLAALPVSSDFDRVRSHCYVTGALTAGLASNGARAVAYAQRAYQLLERAGYSTEWERLRTLITLAGAQNNNGMLAQADATYRSIDTGFRRLHVDRTGFASTLYNNWAITALYLGQPRRAEEIFDRVLEIRRASGHPGAISATVRSSILTMEGRTEEAVAVLEDAADVAVANHNPNALTMIRGQLTNLRRERGDLDGAQREYAQLAKLHRQLDLPANHEGRAMRAFVHAQLLTDLGDLRAALAEADAALAMHRASSGAARRVAMVQYVRADILLAMKDLPEARLAAQESVTTYERLFGPGVDSYYSGRAWLAMARVQAAAGEAATARESARTAHAHLLATVGAEHPLTREAAQHMVEPVSS